MNHPQLGSVPSNPLFTKPFRPFRRGTTLLRGLTKHGYESLPNWDDPPSRGQKSLQIAEVFFSPQYRHTTYAPENQDGTWKYLEQAKESKEQHLQKAIFGFQPSIFGGVTPVVSGCNYRDQSTYPTVRAVRGPIVVIFFRIPHTGISSKFVADNSWLVNLPSGNKGLIRAYSLLVSLNKAIWNPHFWGVRWGGEWLISHTWMSQEVSKWLVNGL